MSKCGKIQFCTGIVFQKSFDKFFIIFFRYLQYRLIICLTVIHSFEPACQTIPRVSDNIHQRVFDHIEHLTEIIKVYFISFRRRIKCPVDTADNIFHTPAGKFFFCNCDSYRIVCRTFDGAYAVNRISIITLIISGSDLLTFPFRHGTDFNSEMELFCSFHT